MGKVSTKLYKALASSSKAQAQWKSLTAIARRDFITWIDSAKQEATSKRRIEKACSMLVAGKRRPCCYSVVPMNLYKALASNPRAKNQWKDLSPDARRDFSDWIDVAKKPDEYKKRIEKVCMMLAAGKQRP